MRAPPVRGTSTQLLEQVYAGNRGESWSPAFRRKDTGAGVLEKVRVNQKNNKKEHSWKESRDQAEAKV